METLIRMCTQLCAYEGGHSHILDRRWTICLWSICASCPSSTSTETKKGVNISSEICMGGGISSYFTFGVSPSRCRVVRRCKFLSMCMSLLHQLQYQFRIATDNVYVKSMWSPATCSDLELIRNLTDLILFCTIFIIRSVCFRQSKRQKLVPPSGQGSHGPYCNIPSPCPLLFIVVILNHECFVGVTAIKFLWETFWSRFFSISGHCHRIPDRLGQRGSGRRVIY